MPVGRSTVLSVLFALSGCASLGLQLVWTRRLGLIAGHEYPATLTVVTGFFAGLALGAGLSRGLLRRYSALGLAALAELVIALWALATIPLLPWLEATLPATGHLVWAGVILLPATVAMGTTLPFFERALAQLETASNTGSCRRVATLYGANTLGAVFGVALAVWVMMPSLGLRGTTVVLATLSAINAIALRVLAGRNSRTETPSPHVPQATPTPLGRRMAVIAGATGFLGLAYEVLGVRLLSQTLEGTVFTYAGILTVYLLGTAAGATLLRWRWGRGPANTDAPAGRVLEGLLLGLVISVLLGGAVLYHSLSLFETLRRHWGDTPLAVTAAEMVLAAGVFGLPTVLMGACFTALLGQAATTRDGASALVGWNLLGGTLAPVLIGALIFPAVGGRWTLLLISAGYGALLVPGRWTFIAVAAVTWTAGAFLLPTLHLQLQPRSGRLVELREGAADTVCVLEPAPGQRTLRVDNRYTMGGTASAPAEQRHAHLPLLLHPQPRKALFLGVGTGISFAAMGRHPDLDSVGIELVPEVAAVQSEFAPHNSLSARQQIRVADARRFIRTTPEHYDVLVADLFHPGRDGAGALYTQEHFARIRRSLAPGGVFCQWLPLYQLDAPTLRSIVRTFLSVFPETDAFWLRLNADVPVLGLIGWTERSAFSADWLRQRVVAEDLRNALRPLGLVNDFQLFGLWFADAPWLTTWAQTDGTALNTEDHPRVLFAAPRATYSRTVPTYALMQELLAAGADTPRRPRWLTELESAGRPDSFAPRFTAYLAARDLYLAGLIHETAGRGAEAEAKFLASARASADFTTGYAQLISRASLLAPRNPAAARQLLEALVAARPEVPVAKQLLERLP